MCVHWRLSLAHQRGTDFDRGHVDAPYYALHPPPPASKTVLSSWSVVICALIAPRVTGITAWHDNRLVVPGTRYQALYTRAQQHIYARILDMYMYQSITCLLRTGITYEYMNKFPLWRTTYLWSYIQSTYVFGIDAFLHYLLFFTLLMRVIGIFKLHFPPPANMNNI